MSIFDAFNQAGQVNGSYHNLEDISRFAENRFSFFSSDSNPCVACHNPHSARRNKSSASDPTLTVISRVEDHESLWGDDESERIRSYTNNYQAPYYEGSLSLYEPGNTAIADGSLTPDYNTFCTDCHNSTNVIASTPLARNLKQFSWSDLGGDAVSAGDKHGKNMFTDDVVTRDPYETPAYVLSCLDCHEPHGSPHAFLIRRGVNGEEIDQLVTINGGIIPWGFSVGNAIRMMLPSPVTAIRSISGEHPTTGIMMILQKKGSPPISLTPPNRSRDAVVMK